MRELIWDAAEPSAEPSTTGDPMVMISAMIEGLSTLPIADVVTMVGMVEELAAMFGLEWSDLFPGTTP